MVNSAEHLTQMDAERRRLCEMPPAVRDLAKHSTVVRHIMMLYVCGHTLTVQEMLTQMVVALDKGAEGLRNDLIRLHMQGVIIVTPQPPTKGQR